VGIGASYLYALAGTAVTAATNSNSTVTVPRGKGRSAKSEAAAFPSAFTPLPFRTIRHPFYPRNPWF